MQDDGGWSVRVILAVLPVSRSRHGKNRRDWLIRHGDHCDRQKYPVYKYIRCCFPLLYHLLPFPTFITLPPQFLSLCFIFAHSFLQTPYHPPSLQFLFFFWLNRCLQLQTNLIPVELPFEVHIKASKVMHICRALPSVCVCDCPVLLGVWSVMAILLCHDIELKMVELEADRKEMENISRTGCTKTVKGGRTGEWEQLNVSGAVLEMKVPEAGHCDKCVGRSERLFAVLSVSLEANTSSLVVVFFDREW